MVRKKTNKQITIMYNRKTSSNNYHHSIVCNQTAFEIKLVASEEENMWFIESPSIINICINRPYEI